MTTFIQGPSAPAPEVVNGAVVDSEVLEQYTRPLDPPTTPPADAPIEAPTAVVPTPRKGGELKPILASWLTDREEFTDKVKDTSKRAAHTTAWHLTHSPLHALRVLQYTPRGFWRVLAAIWGWVHHAETKPLRRDAVAANQTDAWLKLEKERKERVSLRWRGLLAMSVLVLIALVLLWFLLPTWTVAGVDLTRGRLAWLTCAIIVAALGYVGRPHGKSLIPAATSPGGLVEPLRPAIVLDALCSLGNAKMSKPEQIRLITDVAREGRGYRVELELPQGVTAEFVMEKRAEFAGAIRRELGSVWPSVGPRHPAHLVVYVSDESMAKAKQRPWPLLKLGAVDVFKPAPLFTDRQGRWIDVVLAYTSGVIGAVPRMGKTFALRSLMLLGALDPRAILYTFELKGTGDLSCMKLVSHVYSIGDEPEDIDYQLTEMRKLREELRKRVKRVRKLAEDHPKLCPENKVTSQIASQRALKLEPILVGVDECQVWFEHEDTAIRNEFIAIATDLVKRGPAVGIISYFATQKPDAKSIPTAIAANAIIRLCLKVFGQPSNDQVLGTGAYKSGLRATMFAFEDKGIAYFKGEGADAEIVRTVFGLNAVAADKVALRARAARELDGRLTGYAAGEEMDREVEEVILVDDVRQVVGTADAMHLADLATGLAELRPGVYGSLDATTLGRQLRTAGVRTDSVSVSGKPRHKASGKGVKRAWLDVDTTVLVGNEDPGEEAFRDRAEPATAD